MRGTVAVSGAKNAVLPVLAATLLTSGKNEILNAPQVRDVSTMAHLLVELGAELEHFEGGRVVLDTSRVNNPEAPYDLVRTMRASCLVLGPLLARLGQARVSLPGGCAIGARPVDLHIKGLEALGAKISLEEGYIVGTTNGLKGAHYFFDTVSVTGTANIMMAATLADGETILENAAREPEVAFLGELLNRCGAKISGAGEDVVTIQGVASLEPFQCRIFPDRIEAATYLISGAITGGEVEVVDCIPHHIEPLILKLREAGFLVEEGEDRVKISGNDRPVSVNIKTQPHPGFATDIQAQFMALMTLARGQSIVTESVFENRFMHVAELRRMGADIEVRGNTAIVRGVERLSGAPVMATDLRASASLVLAALAAQGESVISRVYHIDRGYERMENKFSQLGADIQRVK